VSLFDAARHAAYRDAEYRSAMGLGPKPITPLTPAELERVQLVLDAARETDELIERAKR
jgi:hypothetical protein